MNERIRELWHKSVTDTHQNESTSWENEVKFVEKFAELIVRECIDTVSDCSVEYCTRPQIVSEIREHFGVEE
jgi:hypothetical protein